MSDDTATLLASILDQQVEANRLLAELAQQMRETNLILHENALTAITGDASDGERLLPKQDTPLAEGANPNCEWHGTPMRRKTRKNGGIMWSCPRKVEDDDDDAPVNDRGYCRIMAFPNDDGTIRYWTPED